jgi:cytochrome b subunit of formate dehydrogenase
LQFKFILGKMNPFELIIKKMIDLGFYDFLFPFIIASAIFYALLKKSKVMGESVVINATLALSIALLIFGFPILAGLSLATPLSSFFTQATTWILIFFIAVLMASFFYPDITKVLLEQFTRRTALFVMIAIGIALFITSGLVTTFTFGLAGPPKPGAPPTPPLDVILIASSLIIFIVVILVAAALLRGE